MNILLILPLVPWPLDRGERIRAWDMLNGLTECGDVTVALVCREIPSPEARAALVDLGVSVSHVGIGRTKWNALVGLLHALPPAVGAYWNRRTVTYTQQLSDEPWDIVVAYQLRVAAYALDVRARVYAIDFTDSLAMFRGRLPWFGRSGIQKLLLTGIDRLEASMPARFDLCWVSAPDDQRVIAGLSGLTPHIVPNGCAPVPRPAPYEPEGPLLFMGDMRYPANEDGIVTFVTKVWTRVCQEISGARLRIVGRPTRRVLRTVQAHQTIELVGSVEHVSDELTHASAVINPVRYGSGTSHKILDGWAMARPVISTNAGARGLTCHPDQDILIANRPEEWLAAIRWLGASPARAQELGLAGWTHARSAYDAEQLWARALQFRIPEHQVGLGSGRQRGIGSADRLLGGVSSHTQRKGPA